MWMRFSLVLQALFVLYFSVLAVPSAQAASLQVSCLRGCQTVDGDQTDGLIYRDTEADNVTLRWLSPENPTSEKGWLRLYAGNPATEAGIQIVAEKFMMEKGARQYVGLQEFEAAALGRGTFVTVITRVEPRLFGEDETLVDWRVWRLLTREERAREAQGPQPGSSYELDVLPVALRARTGFGDLPSGKGGDAAVWFSLVDHQDRLSDVDLDGENNGAPGLGIHYSKPWAAGAGSTPMDALKAKLQGIDGHQMRMEDLKWTEEAAREVPVGTSGSTILLRHYYTVVTVNTSASFVAFKGRDLELKGLEGLLDKERVFLAHETSDSQRYSRLLGQKVPHPYLWASYARRRLGTHEKLLQLLHDRVADGSEVPGLGAQRTQDGDGGPATWNVGFTARVQPWMTGDAAQQYTRAGFVGLDVVAARVGYGHLKTDAGVDQGLLGTVLEKINGPQAGKDRVIPLDALPEDYYAADPSASLGTKSGALPILQSSLEYAQRGEGGEVFPAPAPAAAPLPVAPEATPAPSPKDATLSRLTALVDSGALAQPGADESKLLEQLGFPSEARFALSATLRAGAVVKGKQDGEIHSMVPIDAYAQWVVKMTVAMLPKTQLVTSNEVILPKTEEQNTAATLSPRQPGLMDKLLAALPGPGMMGVIVLGGVLILAGVGVAYVSGPTAAIKMVISVVTFPVKLIQKVLQKLSGSSKS